MSHCRVFCVGGGACSYESFIYDAHFKHAVSISNVPEWNKTEPNWSEWNEKCALLHTCVCLWQAKDRYYYAHFTIMMKSFTHIEMVVQQQNEREKGNTKNCLRFNKTYTSNYAHTFHMWSDDITNSSSERTTLWHARTPQSSFALFSSNVDRKLPIFRTNFVCSCLFSASKMFICTNTGRFSVLRLRMCQAAVVRMWYKNTIHLILHAV